MYSKKEEEIFKILNSNTRGLDSKEAKKRLNDFGQNIILNKKKTPWIIRFLKQFNDTMIIILLIVALLLYFYGYFYSHEYTDTIVILFVVFINAIVGFIQEEKASLILKDLKKYETSTCKVKRDDKIIVINTKELVPGDIIYLESGETVPADIRIFLCENLKVDESALTGESVPVQKTNDILKENLILQEQKNMLFLGTSITNGKCTGIVVSTGKNTEIGKIALSLNEIDRIETPLQLKIKELSKKITFIVFIILTVVLSCLYSCLNITKSTNNLEKNLYKISNTSLSITKNNGDTFETNQFKELDNIKEIKEIITTYDGLARTTNIKVVDGTQLIERDDLSDEFKNMLSVEATNNSEKDNLFSSGIFTIIKGRHINNNDRGKILIHKELAEKNNLNLNDKIKLQLIDFNNSEKKKEYEFEIIGIFTGKKQEKFTGLSSDFSENMVFIDYESSQKALNKTDNNKIVNKLAIFSDSSENTKVALNKIKKMKIDWSQYSVSSDDHVFEETLESIDGIKHIIKIMTYSIMIGGITVLSLILILWLRERIHEIGILLSIGISKIKIVTQFILELLFISLPSLVLSLFIGNVILNIIVGRFMNSDDSTIMVDSLLKNNNLISNLITFMQSYGILIGIIVLSVIIASLMILIKKPKEILSKIS